MAALGKAYPSTVSVCTKCEGTVFTLVDTGVHKIAECMNCGSRSARKVLLNRDGTIAKGVQPKANKDHPEYFKPTDILLAEWLQQWNNKAGVTNATRRDTDRDVWRREYLADFLR